MAARRPLHCKALHAKGLATVFPALAEMTSGEWASIIGVIAVLAVPIIAAGVAVFVKLSTLSVKMEANQALMLQLIGEAASKGERAQEEIKGAWKQLSRHEGRLDTHDKILSNAFIKHHQCPTSMLPSAMMEQLKEQEEHQGQ